MLARFISDKSIFGFYSSLSCYPNVHRLYVLLFVLISSLILKSDWAGLDGALDWSRKVKTCWNMHWNSSWVIPLERTDVVYKKTDIKILFAIYFYAPKHLKTRFVSEFLTTKQMQFLKQFTWHRESQHSCEEENHSLEIN